jgi:hypothetical protein
MKKRCKAVFVLLALLSPHLGMGQFMKFDKGSVVSNTIAVPSGEMWQVVTYSTLWWNASEAGRIYSSTNQIPDAQIGLIPITRGLLVGSGGTSSQFGTGFAGAILVGPAFMFIDPQVEEYFFLFKKVSSDIDKSTAANSVIIPSSANGDVDVKLEQSADNVTWTECLPGTYNSSTVKRFFRLRAVEK